MATKRGGSSALAAGSSDTEEEKPLMKKLKKQPVAKKVVQPVQEDEEEEDAPAAGGADDDADEEGESGGASPMVKNADGSSYCLLAKNRRVTVRSFKKNVLIDIRETYDKDGQEGLPGKKGISLTPEQWHVLKASFSQIDAAISKLA